MKTNVLLPNKLFEAAETFAQEHRLSRSGRYARALLLFLQAQHYEGITDALNQVYADEANTSTPDSTLRTAQARALPEDG